MSGVGPYFSWKRAVIAVLRRAWHLADDEVPHLTLNEIIQMESYWACGASPEDFVESLPIPQQVEK